MTITIIGAGNMGYGIGTRIVAGGHELTLQDKDNQKAREVAAKLGQQVKSGLLGDTIESEIVILALPYHAIPDVIKKIKQDLAGKILVDISNPVNFDTFELIPPANSSGAEEIAKLLPESTKIDKAFNTTFAETLEQGTVSGEKLDVFIASDDEQAASVVARLADDGGLRGLYVGPLKRAGSLEEIQLIHMSLQEKLGTNWMSAIKLIG